jgi:L-malate glycosyltransferase
VITMHGGTGFASRWRRRAALRWAFRSSSAIVAVSRSTRDQLAECLNVPTKNIQVVPNGIKYRAGERQRVRCELGLAPDEPLLLAVGNLYPVKAHIVLLRALALLNQSRTAPWRLVIAGRGGEEESLRAYAAEHGLNDRVQLLGYRADVPDLLAAADLWLMPSLSEGLPLALIEAMFAKKAIITSAVGGIPDVVRHGIEGLLVPPGEAPALAAALEGLIGDPGRRAILGEAAARRAAASFAVESMADAYEELYLRGQQLQESRL